MTFFLCKTKGDEKKMNVFGPQCPLKYYILCSKDKTNHTGLEQLEVN